MNQPKQHGRRTVLKTIGAGIVGSVALTGSANAKGNYGNGNGIGAFLNEKAEFKNQPVWENGVIDKTGQSEADVLVGGLTSVDIPESLLPPGEDPPEELPVAFTPVAVKVSPGTTVKWTWAPGIHHSVTSYNASADGPNDHGHLFEKHGNPGNTLTYTFDNIGTYLYFCIPHGTPYKIDIGGPVGEVDNLFGMRGTVRVSDD